MRQIDLMVITQRMDEGMAYRLSRSDMMNCAEGNLSSLLFDSVRESDIDNFIKQIENNWDVSVKQNILDGSYTIHKNSLRR